MEDKAAIRAEAQRLRAHFEGLGAAPVEVDVLQPADTLLDLYGEDIRARAYVTADPLRGEQMLRPDFTVPVVQGHLAAGRDAARYTYAGTVFRRQEEDAGRASEYLQTGFEDLGGSDPAQADAQVFAALASALSGRSLRAAIGDIGILIAAVKGLTTTDARKAQLLRHLWRPARFHRLLDQFAGRVSARASVPAASVASVHVGLRGPAEIAARLDALEADAATPAIPQAEAARLDALLMLRAMAPAALIGLRELAEGTPTLSAAVERFAARLDALRAQGVDIDALEFEASYGRTTLEYYDGFVFGFYAPDRPDLPPVATGGRYDALTRVLSGGAELPAVGGVIRPAVAVALEAAS